MNLESEYNFLEGGGEMGKLIRARDWSKTPLGPPKSWPQSLRIAVRLMLDSPFAMYISWGPDYTQLYNDGYRPILGATKHPEALGIGTPTTFAEIWPTIGPMFEDAMQGKPIRLSDFVLHLDRNGYVEECVFDFSYSPIRLKGGEVGGVLVTVIETTEKVNNFNRLVESNEQLNFAIEAAELATWEYNPFTKKFIGSNRLNDWFGFAHTKEMVVSKVLEVVLPNDRRRFSEALEKALQYESGGDYDIEYTIINANSKQERIVKAKGRVSFGNDKLAYRLSGTLQDITEQSIARKLLEASEKRFSTILSQSILAIGILEGPKAVIAFANDSLLTMWGKEKSVIGKPLLEALPEIKDQIFPELIKEVFTTGEPYEAYETKAVLIRNGMPEEVYFNFIYQPYKDIDNTVKGITIFATEVTQQVLAKVEVEASEKRFIKIVHQSPFAFAILRGKDMIITLANDAIKEIWGKGNAVEGIPLFQLLPELQDTVFPKLFEEVYSSGEPHLENEIHARLEHNGVMKDMYFNQVYQPYYEADDTIVGVTIIAIEVTQQVHAKRQMEQSENHFHTFADSLPSLAWIANADGWIYWYNRQWYEYTGATLEDMEGWGWIKVHHPDHVERVATFVKEAWNKEEAFEITFPLRRHDGVYRWFLTRAFPVKNPSGTIERWIGTNTDITEQKYFTDELEIKVKERTQELLQKNLQLEHTNAQLTSFSYISSHDLQEPLRKIQMFSSRILETEYDNLSESAKNYFQRMQRSALRMQNLIEDLIAYFRTNVEETKFESIDFNDIIKEVKETLMEELEEKDISFVLKDICEIKIIPIQFTQVLLNLVSNAIKFAKEDQPIVIEIECKKISGTDTGIASLAGKKQYIHIRISDNGIGFEPQYNEKIFDVFQRLHGKEEYEGTGMGLAIVKRVIENHYGVIRANGRVNEGATFDIYLPV